MSRLVGFAYTETALRFLEANIPKTLRTSLEAKRKELKAPALERSRLIDSEAKRIESGDPVARRPDRRAHHRRGTAPRA